MRRMHAGTASVRVCVRVCGVCVCVCVHTGESADSYIGLQAGMVIPEPGISTTREMLLYFIRTHFPVNTVPPPKTPQGESMAHLPCRADHRAHSLLCSHASQCSDIAVPLRHSELENKSVLHWRQMCVPWLFVCVQITPGATQRT